MQMSSQNSLHLASHLGIEFLNKAGGMNSTLYLKISERAVEMVLVHKKKLIREHPLKM